MKVLFVMPSGIEFIKEVGSYPQLDYRIAMPREIKPMSKIDFEEENYLLKDDSVHLVFEFNRQKLRYEYKYMI